MFAWSTFTADQWNNFNTPSGWYYFDLDPTPGFDGFRIDGTSNLSYNIGVKFGFVVDISGIMSFTETLNLRQDKGLDLYISGRNIGTLNVPLYILGAAGRISNTIPLYIGCSGQYNNIPLYVKGAGKNKGYIPYNQSFPLFIGAPGYTEITGGVPLYIGSNVGSPSGNLNLYVCGGTPIGSGLPLWISGIDIRTTSLQLYTHGY
jgi:hypothetical protein